MMCCMFQRLGRTQSLDDCLTIMDFSWGLSTLSLDYLKKGMFVGNGYVDGRMLKFHVMSNKPHINNMNNPSTYFLILIMYGMLDLDMLILTH